MSLHTGDPVSHDGALAVVQRVLDDERVHVAWVEGGTSVVDAADLLTDSNPCRYGGDPRGGCGCGEPCWPGEDYCPRHGGAGPDTL